MKLHEIREALATKTREMRQLLDAANGADLADTAKARFDALETESRALNDQLGRETRIAELERNASATALNGGGTPDFDREVEKFSLLAAGRHVGGMPGEARRELEISQEMERRMGRKASEANSIFIPNVVFNRAQRREMEKRVLLSGSSGAGMIPTEHHPEELVSFLYSKLVTARLGARVIDGLVGNFTAPAVNTGSTSQWVAENGAITKADYSIGSKTASPKHVAAYTEASRNMMQQSSPAVDQLFASDMAANIASAINSASLRGGGTNEPAGVIKVLSDASDTSTFATPTWAQGLAMVAEIDQANALDGSLGWTMSPAVAKKLQSTLVAASTDSRMIMSAPDSLYGYPAVTTSALHDTTVSPRLEEIIFGNWADLLICQWAATELLANPYETTAYSKGNVQFRAMSTVDVVVRRNKSFRVAKDMSTS